MEFGIVKAFWVIEQDFFWALAIRTLYKQPDLIKIHEVFPNSSINFRGVEVVSEVHFAQMISTNVGISLNSRHVSTTAFVIVGNDTLSLENQAQTFHKSTQKRHSQLSLWFPLSPNITFKSLNFATSSFTWKAWDVHKCPIMHCWLVFF